MILKKMSEKQVRVAGKHVLTSNGVVKVPDDSVETVPYSAIVSMYSDAAKQIASLSKVTTDWEYFEVVEEDVAAGTDSASS